MRGKAWDFKNGAVRKMQYGSDFGEGPKNEEDGRRGLPLLRSSARERHGT